MSLTRELDDHRYKCDELDKAKNHLQREIEELMERPDVNVSPCSARQPAASWQCNGTNPFAPTMGFSVHLQHCVIGTQCFSCVENFVVGTKLKVSVNSRCFQLDL